MYVITCVGNYTEETLSVQQEILYSDCGTHLISKAGSTKSFLMIYKSTLLPEDVLHNGQEDSFGIVTFLGPVAA